MRRRVAGSDILGGVELTKPKPLFSKREIQKLLKAFPDWVEAEQLREKPVAERLEQLDDQADDWASLPLAMATAAVRASQPCRSGLYVSAKYTGPQYILPYWPPDYDKGPSRAYNMLRKDLILEGNAHRKIIDVPRDARRRRPRKANERPHPLPRMSKYAPLVQVPEPTQIFPLGVTTAGLKKVTEYAASIGFDDPAEKALSLLWAKRQRARPSITRPWTFNKKTGAVGFRRSRGVWARTWSPLPAIRYDVDEPKELWLDLGETPWPEIHYADSRKREVDKGAFWRCSFWPKGLPKYRWSRPRLKQADGHDAQLDRYLERWRRIKLTLDEGQVHWAMTTTDVPVKAIARSLGMTHREIETINEQAIGRLNKENRNELIAAMLAAGATYKDIQKATGLSHSTVARIVKRIKAEPAPVQASSAAESRKLHAVGVMYKEWTVVKPRAEDVRQSQKSDDAIQWCETIGPQGELLRTTVRGMSVEHKLIKRFLDNRRSPSGLRFKVTQRALREDHVNLARVRGCHRWRFVGAMPTEETPVNVAKVLTELPGGMVLGNANGIRFMRAATSRDKAIAASERISGRKTSPALMLACDRSRSSLVLALGGLILYAPPADEDEDRLELERFYRQDNGSRVPLPSTPLAVPSAIMLKRLEPPHRRRRH
jgi:hypothetical protein